MIEQQTYCFKIKIYLNIKWRAFEIVFCKHEQGSTINPMNITEKMCVHGEIVSD